MKNYVIGLDIGGTNIKFGIVNRKGKIVAREHLATKQYASKKKLIIAICEKIEDLLKAHKLSKRSIRGIGIGLPGLIDPVKGMVIFLPNISGWRNVPLKEIIEKNLGIPTFLENDVNLIALGEWKFGAGRGTKNMICMTLGTGIGAGLILDNKLYRGEGYVAGELGHIPLNEKGPRCNCGGFGCFERYVGNQQLEKKGERLLKKKGLTFPQIKRMALKGNKKARQLWQETAIHIGNGLIGAINLLNPRLIVIGGGISNNYPLFRKTVRKIIDQRAMQVQSKMVKIARARLGNDAGIIGVQVLIDEKEKKTKG